MSDTPKTPVRGVDYDTDTSSMRGFAAEGFNVGGPNAKPAPAPAPRRSIYTEDMSGYYPGQAPTVPGVK